MSKRPLVYLLTVFACLSTAPASDAVSHRDAAATRSYLLARIELAHTLRRQAAATVSAIDALAARLRGECSNVLAGTPLAGPEEVSDPAAFDLDEEIGDDAFGAGERVDHGAEAMFYATVKHLRWSDPKLTKLLRSLALETDLETGIPATDLCADLRSWIATGYKSVPPETLRIVHEVHFASRTAKIDVEPDLAVDSETVVEQRLRRYQTPSSRRLFRLVFSKPNQHTVEHELHTFFAAVEQVDTALGRSVTS